MSVAGHVVAQVGGPGRPVRAPVAAGAALGGSRPVSLAAPVLWLTGLERWVLLAGLALALGGLAGRGLARQHRGPRPAPLPPPWALRGSLLGLVASASLLVTASADPSLAERLARPRSLGLPLNVTAVIAGAEVVCFAAAAGLLRLRQPGWSVVPLLGVVGAEGLRSHAEGVLPVAGAALAVSHLLPALLWAGMLAYTLRAALAWRADPPAMQALVRLYATAAAWLFALVVVTGVVSETVLAPLGSLLTTTYGRFLVVKAAAVAVAAGLAIGGRVWLARRRPGPGEGPALATRVELAGLAAVLAITGVLTVLTPPAKPAYAGLGPEPALVAPGGAGARSCRAAGSAPNRANLPCAAGAGGNRLA